MDLPVEVVDQSGSRRVAALVDVQDGAGAFWVPDRTEDATVELDPMGFSLAYSRTTNWVKTPACERPTATADLSPPPKSEPVIEDTLKAINPLLEDAGSVTE